MKGLRPLLAALFLTGALGAALPVCAEVPPWVRAVADKVPDYAKDASAVILLDATYVEFEANGTVTHRVRRVAKVLTPAGRDVAELVVEFDRDRQLRTLHGWSIGPNATKEVRERDAIETSPNGDLYADQRLKVLTIPDAQPGSIVAWEYEVSEHPQALQAVWSFQEEIPVVESRFALTLPAGWSSDVHWFNHAAVERQAGVWTLRDLRPLAEESRRPSWSALSGRMALNVLPGAAGGARTHLSWDDVGRWYAALSEPRCVASPALQAKVHELGADNGPSAARLEALARFAQRDVRYVAVEIGIGGYQPHPAADIFKNRYGDCKDKVTVMRTMLHAAGIESYYVLVNTRRGVVDRDFATSGDFNHAIIAIRPPQDLPVAAMPALASVPRAGKVLFFDPTNPTVPLGLLPDYLQAGQGLLVLPDGGELVDLPLHPPEASQLVRQVRMQLDGADTLVGRVEERRVGAMAADLRDVLLPLTAAERIRLLESMLAGHLTTSSISDVQFEGLDDPAKDLVVTYRLSVPLYARRMAGMVLIRPRVLGQKAETMVDPAHRVFPYVTDGPSLQIDDEEILLPEALKLDELPAPVNLTTPVLTYTSASTLEGNVLRYHRQYAMRVFSVPVSGLPELNKAFGKIGADEKATAVFK